MDRIIYKNTEGRSVVFHGEPPYILKSKDGFGSVDNIIESKKNFNQDGQTYISSSLDVRNLIIRGVVEGSDYDDLLINRRDLISIFNPKVAGQVEYQNDHGTYLIDVLPELAPGFDESGATLILPFIITLKALDPYWIDKSLDDGLVPLSTIEPKFKFPLSLSSGFAFAAAKSGEIIKVTNAGDVAIGGLFRLRIAIPVVNPRIYNIYTQEYFGFTGSFSTGTVFEISTVRGNKYVRKFVTQWENAMSERMVDSSFLQIAKGDNYFQIQAESGIDGCLGELEYQQKLLGV